MFKNICNVICSVPIAKSEIRGNKHAPYLTGTAKLYPWANGSILKLELVNLPIKATPFAVHIHDGLECSPDDFSNAGTHFNPTDIFHPAHSGDLPPIFSNNGYGMMIVFTNRFRPCDVLGKPIIIHNDPDDFVTQPGGNSGKRIGCGIIKLTPM